MANDKVLDNYMVAFPIDGAALVYVYNTNSDTEYHYPKDEHYLKMPLKESIKYVKNNNRDVCFIIHDRNPIVEKYLCEKGMNI